MFMIKKLGFDRGGWIGIFVALPETGYTSLRDSGRGVEAQSRLRAPA